MVALGFINGQNDTGEGGNAAVYTGQTADSASTVGFHLTGHFIQITDKSVLSQINYFRWPINKLEFY